MRDDATTGTTLPTTDPTGLPTGPSGAGPDPDARSARAALASASDHQRAVGTSGLWFARYMTVFGLGFGVLTLLLGLGPTGSDAWWVLAVMALWGVLLVVMVAWALRRPVMVRPPQRIVAPGWAGTAALYGLALVLGLDGAYPAWAWLLAALVVPVPLLLAAAALRRRVPRALDAR